MSKLITKSKYMIGLKCEKYLWIIFNNPEAIPKVAKSTRQLLGYGYKIEDLAKEIYPSGIDIPTDDFMGNINETQNSLKLNKPLFEPGFLIDNIYSRIDILKPVDINLWDLIEIKQSTKVKKEHIPDIAFQKYCLESAGIVIRKSFIAHVNKEYIKHGKIDPNLFIIEENVDDLISDEINNVPENISRISQIINLSECPDVKIGVHCKNYYTCPLYESCSKFLPEYNVLDFYRGGKKSYNLIREGKLDIKDATCKLTDRQKIQFNCAVNNKIYINKANIKRFIDNIQYPIYFMDFETIFEGIPLYDNTSPYQQIPFQFSVHLLENKESGLKHFEFLAEGLNDPRQEFIKELHKILGDNGSIIVYNESFEKSRLKELAKLFPKYENWVDTTLNRIIDLIKPFRAFDYYNQNQHGSCSLKYILPAIVGRGYDDLEIQDGGSAGQNWLSIFNSIKTKEEIEKIRTNLKLYCKRDTESMIWILNKLKLLSYD